MGLRDIMSTILERDNCLELVEKIKNKKQKDNNNQGSANSWLSSGCVFTVAPLV